MNRPAAPRTSGADPRVARPRPGDPPRIVRCGAVEPESGERCEGMAGHVGPHSARVTVLWHEERVS